MNYFVSFLCCFFMIKKLKKTVAMHNSHKNYLSNLRQVLLFLFQHEILQKVNRALQNIHWNCLNVQSNFGICMYFLFLHVKIKTLQKIS